DALTEGNLPHAKPPGSVPREAVTGKPGVLSPAAAGERTPVLRKALTAQAAARSGIKGVFASSRGVAALIATASCFVTGVSVHFMTRRPCLSYIVNIVTASRMRQVVLPQDGLV